MVGMWDSVELSQWLQCTMWISHSNGSFLLCVKFTVTRAYVPVSDLSTSELGMRKGYLVALPDRGIGRPARGPIASRRMKNWGRILFMHSSVLRNRQAQTAQTLGVLPETRAIYDVYYYNM